MSTELSGTAKGPTPWPMSAVDQYEAAIKFKCPFCGVEPDVRCTGIIFPQYPHTDRLHLWLLEQGWSAEQIDAQYRF